MTYEIIAIPLCFLLTFKIGSHAEMGGDIRMQDDSQSPPITIEESGMGLAGMWTGFAISMLH